MTSRAPHRALPPSARYASRGWRGRVALVIAGVSPLVGCYTTRPVMSAPEPGTTVMLDLNDRARVELADRIGPSAARIEGIVQSPNETGYMLRVSSVSYLNGQSNRWSGEALTVPGSLVASARIREFSRSRTVTIGVGIAAALITAFLKANFFGSSGPDRLPDPPTGGGT